MKRVLIIKTGAIGDLVMATPMLSALHAAYPGIQVIWLVERANADLLRGIGEIHRIVALDAADWNRDWRKARLLSWLRTTLTLRRELLKDGAIDAIICTHAEETRWWPLLRLSRIRIGLHPRDELESRKARRYTKTFGRPLRQPLHNIDHYLMATRALGCLDTEHETILGQAEDEASFAAEFRQRHNIDGDRPLVLVAPFTTWPTKNWEASHWADLIKWLVAQNGARILLTMAKSNRSEAYSLRDTMPPTIRSSVVLAEDTTLRQFVALVRCSDLVISVDSSALHIAAAAKVPYIALFGPTKSEEIAPPNRANGRLLMYRPPCAPCGKPTCGNPIERECMKRIRVTDVQDQVALLGLKPAQGNPPA